MEKRRNRVPVNNSRNQFQGAMNILDFNRHYYYYGFIALTLVVFVIIVYPPAAQIGWIISGLITVGLISPLLVSAYVYDFSDYYKFEWLNGGLISKDEINSYANIHAGFDETSIVLQQKLKVEKSYILDFYNEKQHTEKAIIRARIKSERFENTITTSTTNFPLKTNSVDAVFLLSSAHEIRDVDEQTAFFKECKRILKEKGNVIVVEHLRDLPNFLAFHIGFQHFFSKKRWLRVFSEAGFTKVREEKFTPFMSIFKLTV